MYDFYIYIKSFFNDFSTLIKIALESKQHIHAIKAT